MLEQEQKTNSKEIFICTLGQLCPINIQNGMCKLLVELVKIKNFCKKVTADNFVKEFIPTKINPLLEKWKLGKIKTNVFENKVVSAMREFFVIEESVSNKKLILIFSAAWEKMYPKSEKISEIKANIGRIMQWWKKNPNMRRVAIVSYTNPWDFEYFSNSILEVGKKVFEEKTRLRKDENQKIVQLLRGKDDVVIEFHASYLTGQTKAQMLGNIREKAKKDDFNPVIWTYSQKSLSPVGEKKADDDVVQYLEIVKEWLKQSNGTEIDYLAKLPIETGKGNQSFFSTGTEGKGQKPSYYSCSSGLDV